MKELDKRILNGINHFRAVMHVDFTGKEKVHLCTLFNLMESRINEEKVNIVDLKEEPRGVAEIFPESEGWKGSATAGLNNATSVSPNETASQQLEDKLSQ